MYHSRAYYLPALVVIILTLSFFRLGSFRLFDVDEAVFSEATKEMVQSGDWLTPTYNGVNRYDKPILFYWLMALSYKAFGVNEFGARFPSALAGCLLSIMLGLFMKKAGDSERALYASLTFVLSIYFVAYTHAAVTDMTLSLFISLSLFSFYHAVAGGQRRDLYLYGFYLFSALAFLTKGLIGIVFPFGIAMAYMLLTERLAGLKKVFSFGAAALFIAVAAPWYLAQYSVNGQEFIDQFFIKHHFRRYTGIISGHKGPVYFYIPALLIGLMPWIVFLPAGVISSIRAFRKHGPSADSGPVSARHSPELLALIWLGGIFIFFSLATTKLPNYILPAVPAASILIASGMSGLGRAGLRYTSGLISAVSLLLGVAFLIAPKYLAGLGIAGGWWTFVASGIMFCGALLNGYTAVRGRRLHEYGALLMLAFLLLVSLRLLPVANDYLQGTLYRFSIYAKENLGSDRDLVLYKVNKPSVVFYSDHRITPLDRIEQVREAMTARSGMLVITRQSEAGALQQEGLTLIEKDRDYALLERK
ncbi:MAG: glycosyltransferase family 39 protein [Nitrospirae bacterium]|nr:MAG: glycosyltransferase family 39 protein [Nitrospirota bacterium]